MAELLAYSAEPSPHRREIAVVSSAVAENGYRQSSPTPFNTYIYVLDTTYAMVSVTLSVPEEMKSEMDEHPEINWSEVARQSIERKLAELRFLETFKEESELTEAEAIELGRDLKAQMRARYEE